MQVVTKCNFYIVSVEPLKVFSRREASFLFLRLLCLWYVYRGGVGLAECEKMRGRRHRQFMKGLQYKHEDPSSISRIHG